MRTHVLAIGAVFAASAFAGPAARAASPTPWYLAATFTGSGMLDSHETVANAPAPGATLQVANPMDFGWGGAVALGRAFGPVRLEAEVGYTENHSSSYTAISPISITLPQDSNNDVTRYMANAYYDVPAGAVRFYVGAGLGAADAHVTAIAAPARAPQAPPSKLLDFSRTVFAYQLMAGLSHPVTPHLSLTAQYRWFDAGTVVGADSRGQRATRDIAGHNIDVGLRYAF